MAGWRRRAAVAAAALTLTGCGAGMSAAAGRAAAGRARQQVVPAAAALYQQFLAASARSASVVDGSYVRCGNSGTRLHYSVSLRLYPFGRGRTSLSQYQHQVTGVVTSAGWALRRASLGSLPAQGPFLNPAVLPSATILYAMTKHVRAGVLAGALFMYPQPGSGVGGSLTVSGGCFDAGPAAANLAGHPDDSPLPAASRGA